MRKASGLPAVVILVTLFLSPGCKRGDAPDLSKLGPSSAATTTVLPVGSTHCPGGGIGIYTGNDTNANGVLEASEVQKGSPVCDTLNEAGKPDGLLSLVMIASEPSSTVHCLAGGLKVLSGPDANRNNVLDTNEIAFTDYLCNGTPGSSSASGITVVAGSPAAPSLPDGKKKGTRTAPAKKPSAAAGKTSGKSAEKVAARPVKEAKGAPAAPAQKESAEAASASEGKDTSAEPAALPTKGREKAKPASASKEKGGSAKPVAAPKGWTSVKVNSPNLASAAYKVEGRSITVRFTNLSATSSVRFKYTVRWKANQGGTWVDDSTMEGIGFRLKAQETLDREVRTQTQDIRDVAVDLDVVETS